MSYEVRQETTTSGDNYWSVRDESGAIEGVCYTETGATQFAAALNNSFQKQVFEYLKDSLTIKVETNSREYARGGGGYQELHVTLLLKPPGTKDPVVIDKDYVSIHPEG